MSVEAYKQVRAVADKVAELRVAAAILDVEPDEQASPVYRAYWQGIARGIRLACATMLDEVLSPPPDDRDTDGETERGRT